MAKTTSDIVIKVTLGEDRIPDRILWHATDSGDDQDSDVKAILLALFERDRKETLRMDLWTRDMEVVEMDRFVYNTLRSMADTYMRATGNNQLAGAMQQFATYFGEQAEIIPREEDGDGN